jgi:hypothetical protein
MLETMAPGYHVCRETKLALVRDEAEEEYKETNVSPSHIHLYFHNVLLCV